MQTNQAVDAILSRLCHKTTLSVENMRSVVLLVALLATALAQTTTYGSPPAQITLQNGTKITPGLLGPSSFLTAEDRRFAVALNWARQDPVTFKSFMQGEGYNMPSPFLQGLSPNFALHWDPNLAGAFY